jgi:hypothetical protein
MYYVLRITGDVKRFEVRGLRYEVWGKEIPPLKGVGGCSSKLPSWLCFAEATRKRRRDGGGF